MRIKWIGDDGAVAHAKAIVLSYDTGVTLRQLFYRLVSDQTLPNTRNYYKTLSSRTAEGRREGSFPDLIDRTSRIEEPMTFEDPTDAIEWLRGTYRIDCQANQEWQIWLGVEKAGMSEQLDAWFTLELGIPHVALGGYASQTLADNVRRRLHHDGRPSVLIYAGDYDPTGEDIDRDFQDRVEFDEVVRIALNAEQLAEFDIPRNVLDPQVQSKLERDPRAKAFFERHGYLDQYEVDALDPDELRRLYQEAIDQYMVKSKYDEMLRKESEDREELEAWGE